MKNTDKVTLTVKQLKKLIKESKQLNEGMIYLGCHVYKDKGNWIIYDDVYDEEIARFSDYEFTHDDINEYEIIRTWRDSHPLLDESYDSNWSEYSQEEPVVIKALDKIWNQLDKLRDSTKYGSKDFEQDVQDALDSIAKAKKSYIV